jgi:UDPglucose 6-dehydrogenase
MKISVIGTGYVGLVSGVCLAEAGHDVVCIDSDAEKVESINHGVSPIHEAGLDDLLKKHIGEKLNVSTELNEAVVNSEISIIAVGTPFDGKLIDLQYIRQVSQQIAKVLKYKKDYHVVVVKSTVVPGTTDDVVMPLLEEYSGKIAGCDFGVGMNPEFLREGVAIEDFMNPDRIVLGAIDSRTHVKMNEMYSVFDDVDILETNNKTAEMIKYTSNSLLATMISFSNEIGNLCAKLTNVDALDVMKGVHLDKRISPKLPSGERLPAPITTYLQAGCGFGGSCFPKDVNALIAYGNKLSQSMQLLKSVMDINREQPQEMIKRIFKHYPKMTGIKIAVLGLAFKPGTDDMRESPSIPIINELLSLKAKIYAYDPVAQMEAKKYFKDNDIIYCSSVEDSISEIEVVLLLTSWPEFSDLPKLFQKLNINPIVIDGRRMLKKEDYAIYEGIGVL